MSSTSSSHGAQTKRNKSEEQSVKCISTSRSRKNCNGVHRFCCSRWMGSLKSVLSNSLHDINRVHHSISRLVLAKWLRDCKDNDRWWVGVEKQWDVTLVLEQCRAEIMASTDSESRQEINGYWSSSSANPESTSFIESYGVPPISGSKKTMSSEVKAPVPPVSPLKMPPILCLWLNHKDNVHLFCMTFVSQLQ